MRLLIYISLLGIVYCSPAKSNVKSLTESHGQEIIEIGSPLKELPPDIDEEPAAENDDDNSVTTTVLPAATKRENKKTTTLETRRKGGDKNDLVKTEDEEARIEKELADMYKDTAEYKAEPADASDNVVVAQKTTKTTRTSPATTTVVTEKPALRQRPGTPGFKFQPDSTNRHDIEKFRTSPDDYTCEKKRTNKLSEAETTEPPLPTEQTDFGTTLEINLIVMVLGSFLVL